VTRGTARFGQPHAIALAPSALKSSSAGLLTSLPLPNRQFKEGDMLFTASGRPVMALQGATPAYRDLTPGTEGADVLQLEQALARIGHDPGEVDGKYDEKTGAAVAKWYQANGFEPFGPTPEQQAKLRALETAMADAVKNKLAASTAAASADKAVQNARLKADLAERAARADVSTKIADQALIALDPRSLQMARVAADAKLEIARSAVQSAKIEGEVAVQAAIDAQRVAIFDAKLAAERELQATAEWRNAMQRMGISVPLDEIVFIPALPARVEQVSGVVGNAASGPILSVTDNQIVIDSSVPLEAAPLVKPGMEVVIDEPSLGFKSKGVVETIAATPGTFGVDGYHYYLAIRVGESQTPLQGHSLRLTMPVKSSEGAVLTVPTSALSLAADGTSRVQVQKGGALEYVTVEPGMAADGYVEVKPVKGTLEAGQLVVVGNGQTASSDVPAKQL
jgi:peptidoglycan hydrolase-like protein with peptidoglycan-binding domain